MVLFYHLQGRPHYIDPQKVHQITVSLLTCCDLHFLMKYSKMKYQSGRLKYLVFPVFVYVSLGHDLR